MNTDKTTRMLNKIFGITGCGAVLLTAYIVAIVSLESAEGCFFLFMCLLCVGICIIGYGSNVKRSKKRTRLMQQGVAYDAEIVSNPSTNFGYRRSPPYLECTYRDYTGQMYLVKSKNVNGISSVPIDQLKAIVYVNPSNPRDYYVDIRWKLMEDGQVMDLR